METFPKTRKSLKVLNIKNIEKRAKYRVLKEKAKQLGIRDLGRIEGTTHPYCGDSPFHYGIKPDGVIVMWCVGCLMISSFQTPTDKCPNCKSKLDYKNPTDPHFKTIGKKFRIVCPTRAQQALST